MKQLIYLLLPLAISCSYEKGSAPVVVNNESDSVRIEKSYAGLNLYPSGKSLLQKISQLQSQGLQLTVQFQKKQDMRALSEGNLAEGYLNFSQGVYKIIINAEMDSSTTTHTLAHELSHVIDDFETDLISKQYPDLDPMARSTVQHLEAGEIKQLDSKNVSYVLNTLFCTEARSYNLNSRLIEEGLYNEKLSLISVQMAQHIDATYIQRYQTTFGSNKDAMLNWCLQFNSMTEIQNNLIRNLNN